MLGIATMPDVHAKKMVCAQIHWLRIILDEGHTLGGTLSETNRFQVGPDPQTPELCTPACLAAQPCCFLAVS